MVKLNRCIVCGSKEFIRLFETHDRMFDIVGKFVIKKCKKCGLVFIDPQPDKDTLQLHYPGRDYYSYKIDKQEDFFGKLRTYLVKHYYNPTIVSSIFSKVIQSVPALPSRNKGKILDIGCGTGDTIALLKELGWDVYGLEIDKGAVAAARTRGLKNVRFGSYEDIKKFPDKYFDAIRLYHVIEHLSNPNRCLTLLYGKLKAGGELILGTPNVDSLASNLFGKFWFNLDIPRHLFLFSPKTLGAIVERAGFSRSKIAFCSAGGIMRSIEYGANQIGKKRRNLQNHLWLFFILYPLEWLFDKLKTGDIMILRAVKI